MVTCTRCHPMRARGIVLVDAIVGSVLLGISLVGFIALSTRALSAQLDGERLQTAAMLLDEQLNLVLLRGPDDYAQRFDLEGACDPPFEIYAYKLQFDGGEGGAPYRVVATIAWTDGGRRQVAAIETMIAPRLGDEPDPVRTPTQPVERSAQ